MSRPETRAAAARALPPEELHERVARLAAAAPERPERVTETTIPSNQEVDLVTVTLDELHDLVFAASSTMLKLSTLSTATARQWATRTAEQAVMIARSSDYRHRGRDPRG